MGAVFGVLVATSLFAEVPEVPRWISRDLEYVCPGLTFEFVETEQESIQIAVVGEVPKPGVIRLAPSGSLRAAIEAIGGFTDLSLFDHVWVVRKVGEQLTTIKVEAGESFYADFQLRDRDVVYVRPRCIY